MEGRKEPEQTDTDTHVHRHACHQAKNSPADTIQELSGSSLHAEARCTQPHTAYSTICVCVICPTLQAAMEDWHAGGTEV